MLALVEDIVSVGLPASSKVPRSLEIDRERLLRVLVSSYVPAETDVDDGKIYEFLKSLQAFHGGTWLDSEQTRLRTLCAISPVALFYSSNTRSHRVQGHGSL